MVVRIVRMHFKPEEIEAFLQIFNANKEAIRAFPGCTYMELMRDVQSPSVLVTLSHWNSVDDLEQYRHSPLFNSVWIRVKKLFSGRPEAFTVEKMKAFS
jgi:quinol monooxygenase YgiN